MKKILRGADPDSRRQPRRVEEPRVTRRRRRESPDSRRLGPVFSMTMAMPWPTPMHIAARP